jgi:hypothetical protein
MKTKVEMNARIRQLSIELAMEEGEIEWEGKYGSPFAAIEARAAEIGDMIACEIAVQRARMANESRLPDSQCACPKCQQLGDLKRIRKRECQTIRGTIELPEPEYYCKKCRGSFFPSDSLDRS